MDSSTTELLIVRHGQSTWNQEHRWQGQADPPLSDLGRKQAQVAAQSVGAVDAVLSSTQKRAHESALIISDAIGVGPVQTFEGLRERSAGEWSGLTNDVIYEKWPDWEEVGYRPAGWEADEDLLARVRQTLFEICELFKGSTLLIVTHSGVLITLERELGVSKGRISNLHGRALSCKDATLSAGERIELLGEDMRTGGGKDEKQV